MNGGAVILTYHAVERGAGPLFVEPGLLAAHLDCIVESGAAVLTISAIAEALRSGTLPERAVAITFDDGCRSVASVAAPLLAERGLPATVFCVAGHVGGESDWPSALPDAPRLALAGAGELAELAAHGWEIGSHGMDHAPLVADAEAFLQRELVDSRLVLEQTIGAPVRSFAYPYGVAPMARARRAVEETYAAACTTAPGRVEPDTDVFALPRIDAHYVRRPQLLRRALEGSLGPYLQARRLGARARRAVRKDYVPAGGA